MRFILLLVFSLSVLTEIHSQPWRKKEEIAIIKTDFGEMHVILYDETPAHKENFLKLCREGFYNGTTFHRVIKNFMIQGGDPNSKDTIAGNEGQGGPGYTLPLETDPHIVHEKGSLAAARLGDNVNPEKKSNGSQFYIVHNPKKCVHLNGSYTVFGKVIKGMEVVDSIAVQPASMAGKPHEDIKMSTETKKYSLKKIKKIYNYEKL
ncbi:peptidylprolyl isomerase [Cytophagaceae bacterium ABcell3]|nr:peptidylprolyl isomerase [Cytophagaceae bacterium ABcell3]